MFMHLMHVCVKLFQRIRIPIVHRAHIGCFVDDGTFRVEFTFNWVAKIQELIVMQDILSQERVDFIVLHLKS